MRIKDIMVGDWVIPHIFDSTLEPSKIVGIHYNSYKGKDYVDWVDCEVWDELSMNDIEPVPLTAEILEKNGFEKWDDGWCIYDQENTGIEVAWAGTILKIGGECGNLELSAVMYVHDLQHALRLCGIEEEITL